MQLYAKVFRARHELQILLHDLRSRYGYTTLTALISYLNVLISSVLRTSMRLVLVVSNLIIVNYCIEWEVSNFFLELLSNFLHPRIWRVSCAIRSKYTFWETKVKLYTQSEVWHCLPHSKIASSCPVLVNLSRFHGCFNTIQRLNVPHFHIKGNTKDRGSVKVPSYLFLTPLTPLIKLIFLSLHWSDLNNLY